MSDIGKIEYVPHGQNSVKQIASALVKAQMAFGPALKSSTNPHFRSRYADLATCVDAVIGGLNDNGIALVQQLQDSPTGVTVETVFVHESGEMLNCGKLFVPAVKQDAQGFGSALTYARRYSLMAACGIAPEDDDGNAAAKPKSTFTLDANEYKADALVKLLKDLIDSIDSEESYKNVSDIMKRNSKELTRLKEGHAESGADISAMYQQKAEKFKKV